jgi:gluconokinase
MSNGIPLTDADRWDWLIRLRKEAAGKLEAGAGGVVLTCSALKQKYRDVIRLASYNDHHVLVHFIYLRVSPEMLLARVKARRNHYMKDDMVKSQLESLEEPQEEEHDVLSIEGSGSPLEVNKLAYDAAYMVMTKDLEAKA